MEKLGNKVSSKLNGALGGDWIGVAFVLGIPLIIGIIIGKTVKK